MLTTCLHSLQCQFSEAIRALVMLKGWCMQKYLASTFFSLIHLFALLPRNHNSAVSEKFCGKNSTVRKVSRIDFTFGLFFFAGNFKAAAKCSKKHTAVFQTLSNQRYHRIAPSILCARPPSKCIITCVLSAKINFQTHWIYANIYV